MKNLVTSTKSIFPNNKVIRSTQSEEEPTGPYVSINLIRDTQVGQMYQDTLLSDSNIMITKANYEALVQFSFVSRELDVAGDMAKTFVHALGTPLTRETFRKNKVSVLSKSPIRNVPSKRESTWVQYAIVDITFTYAVETRQTMVPITAVQITEEITGTVFTVPPDVVIP